MLELRTTQISNLYILIVEGSISVMLSQPTWNLREQYNISLCTTHLSKTVHRPIELHTVGACACYGQWQWSPQLYMGRSNQTCSMAQKLYITHAVNHKTPFEMHTGAKPNLFGLPEWGCKVWIYDANGLNLMDMQKKHEESKGHWIYWAVKKVSECCTKFQV